MSRSSKRKSRRSAIDKEFEQIDCLFESYVDKSSEKIGPEGIELLCSDLEIDHTDFRILILAWKMGAEKQGYFTKKEWRRGLKELGVDTISKLKKALSDLEKKVRNQKDFLDLYAYSFRYCLTEERQKCLEIECICVLLDLILGSEYSLHVGSLIEYLKNQNEYKMITMDQWMGFLRFLNEINLHNLDNYDPANAWPTILDTFVEWIREKQS